MMEVAPPTLIEDATARLSPTRGLQPFDHQVAGQSLILRYDDKTICKCLIRREYEMYRTLPSCLKPFVPQYKGVTQLFLPDPLSQCCPPHRTCPRPCRHRPSNKGSPWGWVNNGGTQDGHSDNRFTLEPNHIRALRKTTRGEDIMGGTLYYFLKMEDLMAPYKNPCVLDLKMGVRQHGDDAPPEKVEYQVNKCKTTTSASLGIRLCGMKKYIVTTGEYESRDKLYGRQLSDEEMKTQLVDFLHNGVDFRWDLVDYIISQLTDLKQVLEQMDGYRFYSCSLLIIYEGLVEDPHLEDSSSNTSSQEDSPRDQYSQGHHADDVDQSSRVEDKLNVTEPTDAHLPDTQGDNAGSKNSFIRIHAPDSQFFPNTGQLSGAADKNHMCHTSVTSPLANQSKRGDNKCVDIRVVDFAHTTCDGFAGDTVKHSGPDRGFLLGVDTMLEVFTDFRDKSVY